MAVVTSEKGVVTADHETCSEIGADVLRRLGGTAVDAAVAVAFSLGVLNPSSSGIGGGSLMVVGSSASSVATAYDMRETAPLAASQVLNKNILHLSLHFIYYSFTFFKSAILTFFTQMYLCFINYTYFN